MSKDCEEGLFICIWCREQSTFPGARFGSIGWACSGNCYSRYMTAYWRVHEPARYGSPTPDERTHIKHTPPR